MVDKSARTVVRCNLNVYNTPLFSFDSSGIYVRCKDCRDLRDGGQIKRGVYHLFTWGTLAQMALGLYVAPPVSEYVRVFVPSIGPSGDHSVDVVDSADHVDSGDESSEQTGNPGG